MIKNILNRREENDTYLTHLCRHCWSRKSLVKIDEIGVFSQHCGFHQTDATPDHVCWQYETAYQLILKIRQLSVSTFDSLTRPFPPLYCICFDGVVIAAQCTETNNIHCSPPNLSIMTWICRFNFAQRPIFSGLRFFNEPEISDSGSPA